ncbi:MAG: deoxyuridine 5-triphosphate nucleotidohydrolase [Thermoleophilia bacterium]|nr:deoxyuridine 5-triphosphate nucleotidohydrolase [Thermoleophilia bacterium]
MTVEAPPALRVVRLDPDAILPTRAHPGDAGLDLYAAERRTFRGLGTDAVIRTGIAVEIPAGWVGLVCPRSGLAARHNIGVLNAPGIIDSGYRGEVMVKLFASAEQTRHDVEVGDRIAQLVVVPAFHGVVEEVDELGDGDRGDAGFGSTGGFG